MSPLPLVRNQFDLSAHEFRDDLALRYKKLPSQMPRSRDGCSSTFSLEHALDCRFGDLVGCCHINVLRVIGDLASLVWDNIVCDSVVYGRSTSADMCSSC